MDRYPPLPPPPDPMTGFAPSPAERPEPRRPGWVVRTGGVISVVIGAILTVGSPIVLVTENGSSAPAVGLLLQTLLGVGMVVGGVYLFRRGWRTDHRRENVLAVVPAAAYAVLVVLALVAAATGGGLTSGSGEPASSAPSGSAALAHRWTGDGVSIDLPDGWQAGAGIDELPEAMAGAFEGQEQFTDMVRLGGYADGPQLLIIMAIPQTPGVPIQTLTDMVVAGVTGQVDMDVTSREDTTVDGQPATRVAIQNPGNFARLLIFTWTDGDTAWVTMWTGGGANFDTDTPTYDAATQTITTTSS